jgi:pantoate--beta-alanine ligase
LHQGHISLVAKSVAQNDCTIASIFVNPIQFNNPNDLKTYPRTIESDIAMLEKAGCDIVFVPEIIDMYPEGDIITEKYDFGDIETVMEGKFRPGHFNGVAVVVKRLFEFIPATIAYFGLKDFQQLAIIKALVKKLQIPIIIEPCPIIRELDGLAMSSRNTRLTAEQRSQAIQISQTLFEAQKMNHSKSVAEIKKFVIDTINNVPLLSVEYFEIVDDTYLKPIGSWEQPENKIGCIAVNVGSVRLIDNIAF